MLGTTLSTVGNIVNATYEYKIQEFFNPSLTNNQITCVVKVQMEKYEGLKPKAGRLVVTIDPHTVQSVTFMTRRIPQKK